MNKGQFAALTAALGLATMAGTGYIAYASSNSHASASGNGSSASASGQGGGATLMPSIGSGGGTGEASPAAQPQGAGTATGPGTDTAPACGNSDVQVSSADDEGAAGHISLLLVFTNISQHDCVLHGYPGASLLGQDGTDLDAQRTMSGTAGGAAGLKAAPHVLLQPNARASAVLEWSDVPTGSGKNGGCAMQDATTLEVTPPNTTQTTQLAIDGKTEVCAQFQVHPVLLGVKRTP